MRNKITIQKASGIKVVPLVQNIMDYKLYLETNSEARKKFLCILDDPTSATVGKNSMTIALLSKNGIPVSWVLKWKHPAWASSDNRKFWMYTNPKFRHNGYSKKLLDILGGTPSNFNESAKNLMTPQFNAWFKGSKVINSDGTPKIVYHGTGADIQEFKYEFTNKGNDQIGSGFYFTDHKDTAAGYATTRGTSDEPKAGGEQANVMPCYLSIKKPIHILDGEAKEAPLSEQQVRRVIEKSPVLMDVLMNFGDVQFEGRARVIQTATESYVYAPLLQQLNMLANDFYPKHVKEFNEAILKTAGYDGVVADMKGSAWQEDQNFYVAWFPSQIKSAIGNKGTYNPKDNRVTESASSFNSWFRGSKVVDASGKPLMMYHGTRDSFSKVDLKKSTLGLFWMTSDLDGLLRGEHGANSTRNVLRCYVSLKNPAGWDEYEKKSIAELKNEGFDGVLLPDADGVTAVAFRGSQVRILPPEQVTESVSPQLKAWFGKSLVKDSKGNPLRVYHGSNKPENIDTFKSAHSYGYYFTDDPKYAGEYSGMTDVGSKTVPVYLKLERPMDFYAFRDLCRAARKDNSDPVKKAIALGFDGVITSKKHEFGWDDSWGTPAHDPRTFVVFSPTQIKSAIGNKGSYSPHQTDITESSEYRRVSSENETVSSDSVPLFTFMTESKAFRNEEMVEKYSTKELGEILFAMLLSIHLLATHEETKRYCIKTLKFPKFDHIFLSSTDLANVITTLRNAKELLGQPNIDIPVNELKRYLRSLVLGNNSPAFVRALFFRMQQRLRIKDGQLLSLRRQLIDGEGHGDDLTYGRPLYGYLRRYQNKCDVLVLLQTLMDRYMVESVETPVKGDCFKDSFSAIASGNAPGMKQPLSGMENVRLVHGLVDLEDGRRGDHAWVEFSAGKYNFVWEPQSKRVVNKEEFYKDLNADPIGSYTQAQALGHAIRASHSGPWIQEPKKLFTELFINQ